MRIFPFWKVRWVYDVAAVRWGTLCYIWNNSPIDDDEFEQWWSTREEKLKEISVKHNVDWYRFEEDKSV